MRIPSDIAFKKSLNINVSHNFSYNYLIFSPKGAKQIAIQKSFINLRHLVIYRTTEGIKDLIEKSKQRHFRNRRNF